MDAMRVEWWGTLVVVMWVEQLAVLWDGKMAGKSVVELDSTMAET